jgi:hypothetical protein
MVRKTSSRWQPSPRTFVGSPNWWSDRRQQSPSAGHSCCRRRYQSVKAAAPDGAGSNRRPKTTGEKRHTLLIADFCNKISGTPTRRKVQRNANSDLNHLLPSFSLASARINWTRESPPFPFQADFAGWCSRQCTGVTTGYFFWHTRGRRKYQLIATEKTIGNNESSRVCVSCSNPDAA